MSEERQFLPVKRGETFLAYLFFSAAAILLIVVFVLSPFRLPPDPGFKGDIHMLILAAVMISFGVVAWRWRPYKSELKLTEKGMIMSSKGMVPLSETDVLWKEVAELRLNVVTNRGQNPKYLHVVSQIEGSRTKKDHVLALNGLEADLPEVMSSVLTMAEKHGRAVNGPKPNDISGWVDGLTWKLSSAA